MKHQEYSEQVGHRIDLLWYIFGLKAGDYKENPIKIPIKWYDSITSSVLYLTLRMDEHNFFGVYKEISIQQQNDLDLLLQDDGSCEICLLHKGLRTNIELLYIYKQILTCFYKLTKLNKSGKGIGRVLNDLKNLLIAYCVESIECSCGYDDEESEEYLGSLKTYFWFDFDCTITRSKRDLKSIEMKIEAMEKYFHSQAYSQGDLENQDKFMYGIIVDHGLMTLLVKHYNITSSTPAAVPIFNIDLTQLVDPQDIVPIVNKILLILELARKEMFSDPITSP